MASLNIFFRRVGTNLFIGRNHHYVHQARSLDPKVSFRLVDKSTLENPMFNMLKVPIPSKDKMVEMEVEFRNTSSQLAWLNPETYKIQISNDTVEIQEDDE